MRTRGRRRGAMGSQGPNHLAGLKPELQRLLSHPISSGQIAYTPQFLSAGRLIGLLTVCECTATLLKSHYSVPKRHFTLVLFHEEDGRLVHHSPSAPRLDLPQLLAAHEGGGGGAPSTTVTRCHASSHMPACRRASEMGGWLLSRLD